MMAEYYEDFPEIPGPEWKSESVERLEKNEDGSVRVVVKNMPAKQVVEMMLATPLNTPELIWKGEKQRIIEALQYHIDMMAEIDKHKSEFMKPEWWYEMIAIKEELENLMRIIKA